MFRRTEWRADRVKGLQNVGMWLARYCYANVFTDVLLLDKAKLWCNFRLL